MSVSLREKWIPNICAVLSKANYYNEYKCEQHETVAATLKRCRVAPRTAGEKN